MPKKIKTISQFQKLAQGEEYKDFFIVLGGGLCKSSKEIFYDKQKDIFYINNCIDDSEQELSTADLNNKKLTNIGEAIKKGCFYAY